MPRRAGLRRWGRQAYVVRDIDGELREQLKVGGFVLLVGDSTAGKSRAAFEAIRDTLADHALIWPQSRDAIAVAVAKAEQEPRCVVWLDELERYLGPGGLTAAHPGQFLDGKGRHHRVIMATIRAAEQERITSRVPGDDAGRQGANDIRRVLEQAHTIRVARMFSPDELQRARTRDGDARIADALSHADSYGLAEYLAAGPELLGDWEDARASSEGPHARGAALVAAAVDIRRAGYISSLARPLLDQVHERYLDDPEHANVPREDADEAWAWATLRRRATAALLRPAEPDLVEVFDYLVNTVQRRLGPLGPVAEPVVLAALDFASPADADSIGDVAYAQGRYLMAERASRKACQVKTADPAMGPDHPDTLASRSHLASALYAQRKLEDAAAEHRAVLGTRSRVLGPTHPHTLVSRSNLALVLRRQGHLDQAENEHRTVLETRITLLGPDHPDTLTSQSNLARVLRSQERFDDAETLSRAVIETRTRVLGPEHPDTLASRSNLAAVLRRQKLFDDAEAEYRAVLEIRTRVLGPDHHDTVATRNRLAQVLRERELPSEPKRNADSTEADS